MNNGGGDSNHQMQQQQWAAMQQYQQHWMSMQPYPAAIVMQQQQQQQMMYNQHYAPYYPQFQQQQPRQIIQNSGEDNRTIWIGDLLPWMDEAYLQSCFNQAGEVVSIKIIRNRHTGQSERYGFIEFSSHSSAENTLQAYNGAMMPNVEQPFRLNWASFSAGDRRSDQAGQDSSIFVGDLSTDVTDALLHDTFASRYPSVRGAKVVIDSGTGRSKGYGFVRFGDENERLRALNEMNGELCSSRPMRISVATPKKPSPQQQYPQAVTLSRGYGSNGAVPLGQSENDSSNTTIFVGGLDSEITDEQLRESFVACGEIVSVKIPPGKGCGFVQFVNRSSAEDSIQRLNGTVIGKQTVRLSWGRSTGNKQWNGSHYGRQNHNVYGESGAGTAYGVSSNADVSNEQPVS